MRSRVVKDDEKGFGEKVIPECMTDEETDEEINGKKTFDIVNLFAVRIFFKP